ncbi:MAG TPA: hypothetical protein VN455_05300, partial [Methanotrichaceae archaeon]|nr:hypothetical protein [Methanotrichaceae archaeon]
TIYSNVEASRHPSIGSVQVDGYAKGKASGLAVGDIADPTYPWDWIGMELNTTSLGTVKVSARLVHPSEHESASKEITSSRAV